MLQQIANGEAPEDACASDVARIVAEQKETIDELDKQSLVHLQRARRHVVELESIASSPAALADAPKPCAAFEEDTSVSSLNSSDVSSEGSMHEAGEAVVIAPKADVHDINAIVLKPRACWQVSHQPKVEHDDEWGQFVSL